MNLVLPTLNLLAIAAMAVWLFRRQSDPLKRAFGVALSVKLIAGVGMGWLYLYHYGAGDTISFWQDGLRLADALKERPREAMAFFWDEALVADLQRQFTNQGPRSLFFVKVCGLLALVGGGNYWVMGAWLSLVAFAASWLLIVRLIRLFPEMKTAIVLVILFFPSVIFWSSGLIKESLGLAALYMITATVLSVVMRHPIGMLEALTVLVSVWVGWNLKYYWLGIYLPVIVPVVAVAISTRWRVHLRRFDLLLWLILVIVGVAVATQSHPNFYVSRFLEVICQNNLEFTRLSEPPRLIQYYNLEPEVIRIVMNAPAALIAGLFRPFFWEAFHALSWISAIENLAILLIVVQALPSMVRVMRSEHRMIIAASLAYALLLTIFLALSTPNFGTLSRYRIGALPFLLLVCVSPVTPVGRWLANRRWFG